MNESNFHYVKQYYPFYLVEYITHNSYELGHVDELKHIKLYWHANCIKLYWHTNCIKLYWHTNCIKIALTYTKIVWNCTEKQIV